MRKKVSAGQIPLSGPRRNQNEDCSTRGRWCRHKYVMRDISAGPQHSNRAQTGRLRVFRIACRKSRKLTGVNRWQRSCIGFFLVKSSLIIIGKTAALLTQEITHDSSRVHCPATHCTGGTARRHGVADHAGLAGFLAALARSQRQVGAGDRRHGIFRQAFPQDGDRPVQAAPPDRFQPRRTQAVRDGAGIPARKNIPSSATSSAMCATGTGWTWRCAMWIMWSMPPR